MAKRVYLNNNNSNNNHYCKTFFFIHRCHTFSIVSTCQEQATPVPPLTLRLEGLKLGQRALYSCPVGYSIEGISNSTCLASGKYYSFSLFCPKTVANKFNRWERCLIDDNGCSVSHPNNLPKFAPLLIFHALNVN